QYGDSLSPLIEKSILMVRPIKGATMNLRSISLPGSAATCLLALAACGGPITPTGVGATGGGISTGTLTPYPTVDCSKRENCFHVACWADPMGICGDVPDPGGCLVGQVHDITTDTCCGCTAEDCDGLPSYCCGSPVCAGSLACGLYICEEIAPSCA